MSKGKDNSESKYIKCFLENFYTQDDFDKFIQVVREDKGVIDSYAKEIWQKALNLPSPTQSDKDISFSEVKNIIDEKPKNALRIKILKIASVAASVIIVLGLLYNGFIKHSYHVSDKHSYVSVLTKVGETKPVILPDGSTVTLNSCSRIIYPEKYESGERSIELTGEAYFQVVKNDKSPFIVKTTHFDVMVLGTEFNIKSYKDSRIFSVSVQSGIVQVDMPNSMIRLLANEIMKINPQDKTFSKERMEQKMGLWRYGRLQFNKTPVQEVAKEMERIYNYTVHFMEGQEFENLITGEHGSQDLESLLISIELATGIHYNINESDKEIVFFKK